MTIEHGDIDPTMHLPADPDGRGVHSIEGFNAVADEAARTAIVQTIADRGRAIYQTGGTGPGWYLALGTTGQWQYLGSVSAAELAAAVAGLAQTLADHAANDDPHAAAGYVKSDGSIPFTAPVEGVKSDILEALATVEYVQDLRDQLESDFGDLLNTYQLLSDKDQADGYAGLDGSSKLTGSQQKYGTTANTAAEGNDTRITTAIHTGTANEIHGITAKTSPVDADETVIEDSAGAAWTKKRLALSDLRTFFKTTYDTLYAAISHASTHGPGGSAVIDGHQTAIQAPGFSAGALTIDASKSMHVLTLSGNVTSCTINNPPSSSNSTTIILVLIQAAGLYTVTLGAAVTWIDGTAPTMPTTSGKRLVISMTWDGTAWIAFPRVQG